MGGVTPFKEMYSIYCIAMDAIIKRLNHLYVNGLINLQTYEESITAIEPAMTQQSAGLPTPDQPAVVTTPRVKPPATVSPAVFDDATLFGGVLDAAAPVSVESLEPSLLEVDLDWVETICAYSDQTLMDEIRDVAATDVTPSNYLDPAPPEKTDPSSPTMALYTLPPLIISDGASKTVSHFPGGDIGWLYCDESLPADRTSIQTPTQTSIQALPFSALGFASCLPEGPPDLEALCAAGHRSSKSPATAVVPLSVSTAPYSAEIPPIMSSWYQTAHRMTHRTAHGLTGRTHWTGIGIPVHEACPHAARTDVLRVDVGDRTSLHVESQLTVFEFERLAARFAPF